MRTLLATLMLWQIPFGPRPLTEPFSFRYRRTVTVAPAPHGSEACATLDAAVYAHATPSLKDLRLFREFGYGKLEVPYAITRSESAEAESVPATVRNLFQGEGKAVFDVAMPPRPYTDVLLDVDGSNFIASAEVSGSNGKAPPTHLGTFTLFDLSARHLGRDTTLPLQESRFSVLHVELRFSPARGTQGAILAIRGATVPPSREAQTLYTVVAETTNLVQSGQETVGRLLLPAHVPVERVSVTLAPEFGGNFSRAVVVTAHTVADAEDERLTGLVQRVRLEWRGRGVRQEQLGFPATLGANLQADATVEVHIQNGEYAPLPIRAVRLEMRERRLCFPEEAHSRPWHYWLFYGDAASEVSGYDSAPTFYPSVQPLEAVLSIESLNPHFVATSGQSYNAIKRHPALRWVALAVLFMLAVMTFHSTMRMRK